jgi:RNA polymerase sigma-70 factor (ECF subfamily)
MGGNVSHLSQQTNNLLATRWSLLARLKDWHDDQSWRQFFDTYWKLIYSVAIQAGLSDAEAQDVVQDTLLSVAKKIGEFKCDPKAGSFKVWLLKLTRWRILNQLKKRMPNRAEPTSGPAGAVTGVRAARHSDDDSTRTATIERVPAAGGLDLDAIWDAEWARNLTETASERVRQKVSSRQFQMFELNVVQGWPVRQVARLLSASAGQVYLAKHRVSRLLKKEIQKLERAKS